LSVHAVKEEILQRCLHQRYKLRKKKKDKLSDPLYLPPEESRKMRSKDKSNRKNPHEEMCLEDGVAGAFNVAKSVQAGAGRVDESVHTVVVSFS
jgi:hypothetical protein